MFVSSLRFPLANCAMSHRLRNTGLQWTQKSTTLSTVLSQLPSIFAHPCSSNLPATLRFGFLVLLLKTSHSFTLKALVWKCLKRDKNGMDFTLRWLAVYLSVNKSKVNVANEDNLCNQNFNSLQCQPSFRHWGGKALLSVKLHENANICRATINLFSNFFFFMKRNWMQCVWLSLIFMFVLVIRYCITFLSECNVMNVAVLATL